MNYSTIKPYDIANGLGCRLSIWVSGCSQRCKGCFNQELWDFNHGQPFTDDTLFELIEKLGDPNIKGLTILGGEPMHPRNYPDVYCIIMVVKENHPDKDIWVYTGYDYENLLKIYGSYLIGIDVLVDGKFDESLTDWRLRFRGSSNQRFIDVKQSIKQGKTILYNF